MKKKILKAMIAAEIIVIAVLLFGFLSSIKIFSEPKVILVTFDGFRWDYLDNTDTPNFDRLIGSGVKAESLIPVFPSRTGPNYYSIITGLYPENHGIIANAMYDEKHNLWFKTKKESEAMGESFWYEGEPIWSTVEKSGKKSAIMFWIGSEAEIAGYRPSYWFEYDHYFPNEDRIKQVLEWLDLPRKERPDFIAVYFSFIDSTGHKYGPDSSEISEAVREADRLLGEILAGLEKRNILEKTNLIILSDHGMTTISPEKTINLDEYIDSGKITIPNMSPFMDMMGEDSELDYAYEKLKGAHPNLSIYLKEEIPEEYHYSKHNRISRIIGIADLGWSIIQNDTKEKYSLNGGNHGYDPKYRDMHGIFIAAGPSFKENVTLKSFQNIQVYNILAEIMNIEPAPNDGNLSNVSYMLKNE
ncbi:ectonucleotide pyrophosphatase/phosphodiesterase [Bacteroidota bacterium]